MPIEVSYYDDEQTKIRSKRRVDKDGIPNGPYQKYYESGELSEEGTNKDGKQMGPYVKYYEGGQIKEKGTRQDTTTIGPFEAYYPNGNLRLRCTYTGEYPLLFIGPYEERNEYGEIIQKCTYTGKEDPKYIGEFEGFVYTKYDYYGPISGSKHYIHCTYTADGKFEGPYEERDRDGNIVKKCTYKDGQLDGEYFEVDKHDDTIRCTYVNGVLDGEYLKADSKGHVYINGMYQKGEKVGPWKEYGHFYEYVDDERNGPYRTYQGSGWYETGTYQGGKKNGPFERTPMSEEEKAKGYFVKGAYKDDEFDGPYERKDGNGLIKCTYQNGEYKGLYQEYDKNGILRIEATLSGHKDYYGPWPVDGEFTSYHENGKVEEHYHAVMGKKTGLYEKRSSDGIILERCSYKDGELDGTYEEYYPSGKVKMTCAYQNGKKEGPAKCYAEDGRVLESANYKNGELDGPYEKRDENGCLLKKCTYRDGYPSGVYHYEYYHRSESYGSINESTKMIEYDMSTEDYWGNWSSAGTTGRDFYESLAQCQDLEVLKIGWTNVDAGAISHCKKLKSLTIDQQNGYGSSGYGFTGEDLRSLGYLPELESLTIRAYGLRDQDMETIHQQFPRLRSLSLEYTDVGRKGAEIVDQFLPHFKISGRRLDDTITKKSFAAAREEEARINGLIGPGYQDKFRDAVARGDAKTAWDIMCYNGLMGRVPEISNSRWEREFGLTDTDPGWGINEMHQSGIFHGIRMKDLGNGNVAFATQYESMSWHSGFDDNNNNIEYSFYGDLSVVNVEEGLLTRAPITFRGLEQFDLTVENGLVCLKGQALPIDPPKREDIRAQLKAEPDPEKRKPIAKRLAEGTYKRNGIARNLISLRKKRDEEQSPLTTRAYQATKGKTK